MYLSKQEVKKIEFLFSKNLPRIGNPSACTLVNSSVQDKIVPVSEEEKRAVENSKTRTIKEKLAARYRSLVPDSYCGWRPRVRRERAEV